MESNYEVEICEGCERQTYIVNRTRMLCADCRCKQLHGMSLKERQLSQWKSQQIRAKERLKNKPPQYKPVKKIPFFSEKGKERHKELLKVKHEVRQQAFDNNEYYCRGCGKATVLDCSHNIGLGQTVIKATDKDNLTLLCHFCHSNWESNNFLLMSNLHCFQDLMKYLFRSDTERFEKKVAVILRHLEKHPNDNKAVQILERLERLEMG